MRKRSFTLIELLVVVAIIAVLVAMLLPALSKARDYARDLKCSNNLRTISTAWEYYLQDFNDVYPYWNINNPVFSNPNYNTFWSLAVAFELLPDVDSPVEANTATWYNAWPGGDWRIPYLYCPNDPRVYPDANIRASYAWNTGDPRPPAELPAGRQWWGNVYSYRDSGGADHMMRAGVIEFPNQTIILNEYYPGVYDTSIYHLNQRKFLMADYSIMNIKF